MSDKQTELFLEHQHENNLEKFGDHDHNDLGDCLVINWKSVVEEREGYEKQEALTQKSIDEKQEEIRYINQTNRAKVALNNQAPKFK